MSGTLRAERPSRGHKKRERTRKLLIGAGLEILAEKGEGLTVSDVVARAEVANGTFYNYFEDRDALFDALAEQLVTSLAAQAAVEIEVEDPALRFAMASARVLAQAAKDPIWGAVVMRLQTMRADVQENSARHLREDLEQGFAAGRFVVGADEATVDLVVAMLFMSIRRICQGQADIDYVVEALCRVLAVLGIARAEAGEIARLAISNVGLVLDVPNALAASEASDASEALKA